MTSAAPASSASDYGAASPNLADLFGQHGAGDLAYDPSDLPVELIDYRPSPFRALADAWRYRRLVPTVFWATVVMMVSQYRLGPTWLFLQTFMSVIGFTVIFGGGVFNVKTPNGMPYILFSMVGMMGWQLFMQTMMMSTRGFRRVRILKTFHLPILLVPIVGSAPGVIRWFISMVAYVLMVIYFWATRGKLYAQLSPRLLAISFAGLALCLVFAWGMGMWTAPLYTWARDMRYLLLMAMPFWMFLTPILYPIEHLHGKMRMLAEINPLSAPIEMVKVGFLGAGAVPVFSAVVSMTTIAVVFLSGVWFITRYGYTLANVAGTDSGSDMMDDFDNDSMM